MYLAGLLNKFKARFCVRDDQQIDTVNVLEILSSVVAWITVRIILIFSMILNMETQ